MIDALGAAFDAYVASGQRIGTSSYSLPALEGYLAVGDVRRASELLDRILAFIAETGERIVEPEIHRLKGECLLAGAAPAASEAMRSAASSGPSRSPRARRPCSSSFAP
jgi:hypothetical protein